jgi:hypothetical protein
MILAHGTPKCLYYMSMNGITSVPFNNKKYFNACTLSCLIYQLSGLVL